MQQFKHGKIQLFTNFRRVVNSMNDQFKCVAYLDILGFKNYIIDNETSAYAANVLFNASHVLHTRIIDQKTHPIHRYEDKLRPLVSRTSVTSFERYLSLSDSIFITSSDTNLFIKQLSTFLSECFLFQASAYGQPNNPMNPEIVYEREWDMKNRSFVDKKTKWYPVLFRGGISYGEVLYDNAISIIGEEIKHTNNIVGKAVVNAVNLEKKGKGPKLFIDDDFYHQLDEENKKFVSTDSGENKYYLWPACHFIYENNLDSVFTEFRDFMNAAINLWKAYKEKAFGAHYFEFMKLVMEAFMYFCKCYYPDNIEKVKERLSNYIKNQDVDLAIFNLI